MFNTECPPEVLEDLGKTLSGCFDIQDVTVGQSMADPDDEFAVVHNGELFDGAVLHTDESLTDVSATLVSEFSLDTLFIAGYGDRDGLQVLSQLVEKRALRAGGGTLYATGHQRFSLMDDLWRLYEQIADAGVDVHVFDDPQWSEADSDAVTVHSSPGLADTWFVVFDGAGNGAAKGALYVVEREPDTYYGLWTVEPAVVDELLSCTVKTRM